MRYELTRSGSTGYAYVMTLGELKLFMSYGTVIALEFKGFKVRTQETFSKTTAKHFKQHGVDGFLVVPDDEFARILSTVCLR